MPSQADFLSSLRPRLTSRRYTKDPSASSSATTINTKSNHGGKIRGSDTSYTLNNWVDLDSYGNASLLNVNDNSNSGSNSNNEGYDDVLGEPSNLARSSTSRGQNKMQENTRPLAGDRKYSASRLKKKSIQLLNMMKVDNDGNQDRKTSNSLIHKFSIKSKSTSISKSDREDDLKRSIGYATLDHPTDDYRGENRYTNSAFSQYSNVAGPSKSTFQSSSPHTPPTPSLITPYLPSETYHYDPTYTSMDPYKNLPSTEITTHTAINPRLLTPILHTTSTPIGTPEYHSFIGDSDSSGKRTTLKPRRSAVPHNSPVGDSPLSGLGINTEISILRHGRSRRHVTELETCNNGDAVDLSRNVKEKGSGRLTFTDLVNLPLPQPNYQPCRYTLPQPQQYQFEDEYTISPEWKSTDTPINEKHTTEEKISPGEQIITMEFQGMKLEDEVQEAETGQIQFEASSALEALWEYGSSDSSSGLSELARIEVQRRLQVGLDEDDELNLEDYPFPPGLSNLPTEESLLNYNSHVNQDGPIRDFGMDESGMSMKTKRSSGQISIKSDLLRKDFSKPGAIQPIPIQKNYKNLSLNNNNSSSPMTSYHAMASPMSDTFSLEVEDEVEEEEVEIKEAVAVAYKIPLKFEKPLSKPATPATART